MMKLKHLLMGAGILIAFLLYSFRRFLIAGALRLSRPRYKVQVQRDLVIPMRDLAFLRADHYHPLNTQGKNPTVLIRSPYGRNKYAGTFGALVEFCAYRFAERGYEVVTQDTRGRFDSEGDFEPYFYEHEDGRATLDWLEQQPWFDGQVGMWGSSYLGIVQWAVADQPNIKALVPGITASSLYEIVFPDDAFDLGLMMRWIGLLRILQKHYRQPLFRSLTILLEVEREIRPSFQHLPVIEADAALRLGVVPYYRRWLNEALHNPELPKQLQAVDHQQVDAPVHLMGGWYDFFLRGLLRDYAALKAAGKQPYLTIGPWNHFSELFIMLPMLSDGVAWFDAHLKGERGKLRRKPVRLYVMGANEWREYDEFPPVCQPQRYFLNGGRALSDSPADSQPDTYHYDPFNPAPIVGGTQFHMLGGAQDNRKLEKRADVLTYTTPVLESPVEVIGAVKLELYAQSSLQHTDFFARLLDIYPDGRSINICDGLYRVQPEKVECLADGVMKFEVDMWATAYRFQKGHRIRLLISSSAHPRWSRHTGGSNPLTDSQLYAADQTIFHDPLHPSALVLPING
jgi:uncharacterized protein